MMESSARVEQAIEVEERWYQSACEDNVMSDPASMTIVSINGIDVGRLTVRALRRFCIKIQTATPRNLKKDHILQLIHRRIVSRDLEYMLYPEGRNPPGGNGMIPLMAMRKEERHYMYNHCSTPSAVLCILRHQIQATTMVLVIRKSMLYPHQSTMKVRRGLRVRFVLLPPPRWILGLPV